MAIIFLLLFTSGLHAWGPVEVTYSRACVAGQCGDWRQAQQQMSNLVIDNPDRAELLYDNGVAAFRLQEFEKAGAYFDEVTKKNDAPVSLKKQAHFNLGNTHVALNELHKAIEQYEAVLAIDPHDERAKHNLEKVRALLMQQQENQNEDKQNQDDQDKNQDGDSDSQQNNSQQKDGNKEQDKQQKGNDSSQQKQGDNKKQESSQGENQEQKGEQSKQDSSKKKDDGASQGDQQGDEEDQADGGSAGQDQNQEQDQLGGGHETSPEGKQNDANNVASQNDKKQESDKKQQDERSGNGVSSADDTELDKDRRAQDLAQTQQKFASNEQWMARLLQRQDKADEQANKRLIKTTVDKNMTGKYGQNNW